MIEVAVRKLLVRFGDSVGLDRVDLTVGAGELFLLLGPSGSGKTTLLRCIAGFTSPDEGSVQIGAEDVTRLAPHLRNTGMVFQSFALWPHLSVLDNVAFGLRERKVPKREVEERSRAALATMRMESRADRRIDQLSGGEQQRVALARALVVGPRCLLLDEPLSNLDAKLRHSMREEIRRVVKDQKLTAIYVTHDQKEALAVADRIAVMSDGRILQIGEPTEVYRRPASRAVAEFIGETNLLTGTIAGRGGDLVHVRSEIGELRAAPPTFPVPAGAKVWVSIRPECVALAPRDTAENRIAGRLESTTYLGEFAERRLVVGAVSLRVYELNPRAGFEPGEVSASVAAGDVVLLPFEGND